MNDIAMCEEATPRLRPGQGILNWRRSFIGRPDKATEARRFVAFLLAGTGCAQDAEFVTAELVSNAILHTRSGGPRGWFGVEVMLGEIAYVSVNDLGGAGIPIIETGGPDETAVNGRGLAAAAALALRLGCAGNPEIGHTVWAELRLPSTSGPE